jgi:hypothetical protein
MDDLFALLPDFAWFPKRRIDARLGEVRARAELARRRMIETIAVNQAVIERKRQAFFRRRGVAAPPRRGRRRIG